MDDYDDYDDVDDGEIEDSSFVDEGDIIEYTDEEWNLSDYVDEVQNDIIEEHSDHLDNLGFSMSSISGKTNSYSLEDYEGTFGVSEGTLAHHNMEDNSIHIIEGNKDVMMHSSTHEVFHAASYQSDVVEESNEGLVETRCSGVLEIQYHYDENGNCLSVEENGRGLNEGITEMMTVDYLDSKEEYEASMSVNAYHENVAVSRQICDVVGHDVVNEAYFGGNREGLEDAVNMYAKDDHAFVELNKDLDIIQSSREESERQAALERIDDLMTKMQANKIEMEEME